MRAIKQLFRKGGSYGVIVPPVFREKCSMRPGDFVMLTLVGESIVLSPFSADRIVSRQEARQVVTVAEREKSAEASHA